MNQYYLLYKAVKAGLPVTEQTKFHALPDKTLSITLPELKDGAWFDNPDADVEITHHIVDLVPGEGMALGYFEPTDTLFYSRLG
jgi:hypothetical protein